MFSAITCCDNEIQINNKTLIVYYGYTLVYFIPVANKKMSKAWKMKDDTTYPLCVATHLLIQNHLYVMVTWHHPRRDVKMNDDFTKVNGTCVPVIAKIFESEINPTNTLRFRMELFQVLASHCAEISKKNYLGSLRHGKSITCSRTRFSLHHASTYDLCLQHYVPYGGCIGGKKIW